MRTLLLAVGLLTVSAAALVAPPAVLAQTSTVPAPGTTVIIPPVEPPPGAPALGLPHNDSAAAGKVTTLGEGMNIPAAAAITANDFVQQAAAGGLFEVEAGRLAENRAQNADVRAFGQQLQHDHITVNRELTALAQAQGISPAAMPTALRQQELQSLRSLEGNRFDREFLAGQIRAHQETIQLFETAAASSGPDMAPFTAFAAQTLPPLRHHLAMAQSLYGSGPPTAAR